MPKLIILSLSLFFQFLESWTLGSLGSKTITLLVCN